MTRASLDKEPRDVAAMFDDVAAQVRPHQRRPLARPGPAAGAGPCVEAVAAQPGERVLDIAAGTGTSSEPFADAGVDVVPADFSLGMLRVGNRRRPDLAFTAADAMQPAVRRRRPSTPSRCPSGCATSPTPTPRCASSCGSPGPAAGWSSASSASPVNAAVPHGLHRVPHARRCPPVARRVSSNPDSYVYLAESIQAWPAQRELAPRSSRPPAGTTSAWRNLTGGIVALHRAVKPPERRPLAAGAGPRFRTLASARHVS